MQNKLSKLLLGLIFILLITACNQSTNNDPSSNNVNNHGLQNNNHTGEDTNLDSSNQEVEPPTPDPITITLSAVGDIMLHSTQLPAAIDSETGEYDFRHNFHFVKPYIERADLALANFESTFAGVERGYTGYPLFNSPDEMAEALKYSGFDVISTVNNHTLDTGKNGFFRTIDVLKKQKLSVIGTRLDHDQESYVIRDVNGIQVGLTAWTYETPNHAENKTLNGLVMPKELEDLIDSFNPDYVEESLEKMEERVQEMKEQGAEVIVFFMHWGHEYHREPHAYQKEMAQGLANYGVDIIFGSHPHVIQPIEMIEADNNDHQTVVVYSMGNFISNQRAHLVTSGRGYTEDGIIVNVSMKKDYETDTISIEKVSYVPTWVHLDSSSSKKVYEILPVVDALDHTELFPFSPLGSVVERVLKSKQDTVDIIESLANVAVLEDVLTDEEIAVYREE